MLSVRVCEQPNLLQRYKKSYPRTKNKSACTLRTTLIGPSHTSSNHMQFIPGMTSWTLGHLKANCTPHVGEALDKWGLFTKWRRSGSAGHFCTRVHAGCMARCVRPRKTHLGRATFCSFCLNTLRVILTDVLCVRIT